MNDNILNNRFWEVLDCYILKNNINRCQLSIKCGKDKTCLNPSKTAGRWISFNFFLKICEVLKIEPQEFIKKMYETKGKKKNG